MATTRAGEEDLFSTTWVHVFERDTAAGAVYCPEDSDVPLSRKPRERLRLMRDGSATLYMPGPDDRYSEHEAEWSRDGDAIVVRATHAPTRLRIVRITASELTVVVEGRTG